MPFPPDIVEALKHAARDAGFDLCGIAPVSPNRELDFFPGWIESGYAGEMRYLESRDDQGRLKRAALEHVAPWARSVIVCALNYNSAAPQSSDPAAPGRGWISRYAWGGADYHDVVMSRLRSVETLLATSLPGSLQTRCYVDTGPLVERVFAKYAGIGWIGKNTCILNQQLGSWLFLGVILTSLELQPDLPAPDRCGSCTRCLDACPTHAFLGAHQLDATKCISYLTIEKRGAIPEELREGMGRHVFGCDICQEVCPWNRKAPVTTLADFQPQPELVNPALEWLAQMSEEDFRSRFRGSPLKRAKRAGLRRNAIVALGNSGDRRFLPLLRDLAADPDPNLSSHAQWALRRLQETVDCGVTHPSHTQQDHGTGPEQQRHTDRDGTGKDGLAEAPPLQSLQARHPGEHHPRRRR
ncbi:MAG TPA: tRNA epoxyqueuosine(34) reductase QueG [Terriglobales bacterium]|nr:tRNA epoxyqueuosine(34) reductase QueG [Terriglobales bacterium]